MNDQEKLELDYLRYFYDNVEGALGPASDDIYDMIRESYTGELPEDYKPENQDY